jgi:GTPase SAR1 family protein
MVYLFDSTVTEQYSAMLDHYLRRSNCILIVFSVTDRYGLEDALAYVDSAERCVETKATTLLVANQIDAANRYISTQQIEDAAKRHGVPFIETSALTGENIQAMLDQAIMIARFGMIDMNKICEMLSQGRSLKELMNPLKNAKKKRCIAS